MADDATRRAPADPARRRLAREIGRHLALTRRAGDGQDVNITTLPGPVENIGEPASPPTRSGRCARSWPGT